MMFKVIFSLLGFLVIAVMTFVAYLGEKKGRK